MDSSIKHRPPRFLVDEYLLGAKRQAKAEIGTATAGQPSRQRLLYVLKQVADLENDDSKDGKLRRYIFAMSALVHHHRVGGLSAIQIRQLKELIYAILRTLGVKGGKGMASNLYSDLHVVLGQIYRKDGEHWQSAWENQLATYLGKSPQNDDEGFHDIASANRAQRLGETIVAMKHLLIVEKAAATSIRLARCRLDMVRALRFLQEFERAKLLSDETLAMKDLPETTRLELKWEETIREATRQRDFKQMIYTVKKGQPHYSAGFILEAVLWCNLTSTVVAAQEMTKMATLIRRPELGLQSFGLYYRTVKAVEESYDYDIPLTHRLDAIGEVVNQCHSLITIDAEILTLAAVVRFLFRTRAVHLTSLVLGKYRSLSLKLSAGKTSDVLGFLDDILQHEWYRNDVEELLTKDNIHPQSFEKIAV